MGDVPVDLHASLSQIITGTDSPPSSAQDDDLTPFPSPTFSGLSLSSDGELEQEVDQEKTVTDADRAAALECKAKANEAFKQKDFATSISYYSDAIQLNPRDPIFWNNRATAKAKLEEFGGAIADASKAVEIDPKFVKAYYRRGLSRLAILRPTEAVLDFKKCLSIDPKNADARRQLDTTVKLIRRIEFEKAISVGDTESTSSRCISLIADGACEIDAGYTGPMPAVSESNPKRYAPTKEFVESMIQHFKDGGKIPKRLAWEIVLGCKEALDNEESLVTADVGEGVHCDVVGDTHGQFYDLCNLLSMLGSPSDQHMIVFNGDFVDRGSWSVEVALTLFAYKWLYPKRVYLNRGNHETSDMNKVYGFEGECKAKHGEMTYKLFADVFTALPLATLLSASQKPSNLKSEGSQPAILSPEGNKRYFVVHGGLFSKDGVTLDDVRKIDRYGKQPGQEGLMCELLWTDPQEQMGRGPSKRGVGVGFGPDVTRRWCEANNVTAVIRSHEVRADGYAIEHDGLCITTFSCPNYCDSTGNKAAYVRMQSDGQLSYHQFDAVPHPPIRPMAYSQGFGM